MLFLHKCAQRACYSKSYTDIFLLFFSLTPTRNKYELRISNGMSHSACFTGSVQGKACISLEVTQLTEVYGLERRNV